MRVIVTRVQPQAARWTKCLSEQFDALALPLIEVGAMRDPSAVQTAARVWAQYAAAMFVSSHAVEFFFKQNQALALLYKGDNAPLTRVWASGPGTCAALLAQGIAQTRIDAPPVNAGQFDSEALWSVVRPQIQGGARVLIVRGDSDGAVDTFASGTQQRRSGVGRDWLAQQLRAAGAEVDFVVAYRRCAPRWTAFEHALARAAAVDGSVWLFSSAEALTHLRALLPTQDWSAARAVATHVRIAQAARSLGFGVVLQTRPTLPDVVRSIKSLQ